MVKRSTEPEKAGSVMDYTVFSSVKTDNAYQIVDHANPYNHPKENHYIGHLDSPSISDRIIPAIISYIKSTGLLPGQGLPSEKELGKIIGVGNRALRESLMILRSTGFLHSHAGKGWYVGKFNPAHSLRFLAPLFQEFSGADIGNIMTTRIANEPVIARLAAKNISEQAIEYLEKTFQLMEEAHIAKSEKKAIEYDIEFHDILARECGNCIQAMFISVVNVMVSTIRFLYNKLPDKVNGPAIIQQHRDILHAIKLRDSERAEEAMKAHLEDALSYYANYAKAHEMNELEIL